MNSAAVLTTPAAPTTPVSSSPYDYIIKWQPKEQDDKTIATLEKRVQTLEQNVQQLKDQLKHLKGTLAALLKSDHKL